MKKCNSLRELALLFLRLGGTSFGGPAAHIAMMEDEVVKRRQWLTEEQFLDMLSATNFIPGPNSTEMAIHIGYQRAGIKGLLVAGISFIIPAVLIVTAIAWAYVHFGTLPVVTSILYGIKPVVIAVIIQALWRLGSSTMKSWQMILIALLAAVANIYGAGELIILFTAIVLAILLHYFQRAYNSDSSICNKCLIPFLPTLSEFKIGWLGGITVAATSASVQLSSLFIVFLKIGSVLFGSGYVLLAFLKADLVEKLGWLTESQLLDAVAVGQITPGPVFTTATFIGYILSGPAGAAVATVGIFLPAFFFVAITAPFLTALRNSKLASCVLDFLNAASLALMGVVAVQLTKTAIIDLTTLILSLLSVFLLLRWKVNSTWLVVTGAITGWISTTNLF